VEQEGNNEDETIDVVIEPVESIEESEMTEDENDIEARKAFIEKNGKLDKRWKEKRIIEESDKLGFGG